MRFSYSPPRQRVCQASGVALVIVLAFVVLLTGLMVAFFSRAVTSRQLSNSSASQTKSALLARSATDTIIAGFKKEIANGSTAATVGSGSNYTNLYVPTPPTSGPAGKYAVPVRYPVLANDPIPNLVRESKSDDTSNPAALAPAVSSNASAVNSTQNPALGGRYVTLARWNSHYLIPSKSTATSPDSTPDGTVGFTAPDWVLVTRNGPAVEAGIADPKGALNDSGSTNTNFVVGRYAYAVYDEGGLLDMNVAGHPTPAATAAQTGFTPTQVSRKGSLALADLTQLPVVKNPNSASTGDYLTQTMVDSIVAWRNYASAGLSSSSYPFPNPAFSNTQAASWFTNFASNNVSGFLAVYGGGATNVGPTDQAFLSRQQLLKLRASLGFSANALQYLGTFSRSLEQPSYVPAHIRDPNAPSINAVSLVRPPQLTGGAGSDDADGYMGNNDAAGTSGASQGQDLINPSFLTVRAVTAFPRLDGSTAVVGEPLVKRRFSLKRLAWITYRGPSASNMSDPVIRRSIISMGGNPDDPTDPVYKLVLQGNAKNILNYFGLVWDPSQGLWTYNHGQDKIRTLSDVANDTSNPREPDFVELLKAAINVGSLAKGGPNLNPRTGTVFNYQYVLDTAVDYNVLQITADLVDQFDADSYPTVIQLKVTPSVGAPYYRQVRGVEDLPYFYRYQPYVVVTQLPDPLISKDDSVVFPAGTTGSDGVAISKDYKFSGLKKVTFNTGGKASFLYLPELWNPHDLNNATNSASYRPTAFRVIAQTVDPIAATQAWKIATRADMQNYLTDGQGLLAATSYPTSTPAALTPINSMLQFTDSTSRLFREPTLLWRADHPTGISLTGGTTVTDVNTGKSYVGILAGEMNISVNVTINGGNYTAQANGTEPLFDNTPGAAPQIDFQLQYLNPAGQWVVYDEKYPDLHGLSGPTMFVNKADWDNNRYKNAFSGAFGGSATAYDPRAGRFGIGTGDGLGNSSNIGNSPEVNTGDNAAVGNSDFTLVETQRPRQDRGDSVNYSNPCMTSDPGRIQQMHWASGVGYSAAGGAANENSPPFYDGLLCQNNPAITVSAKNASISAQLYYEDPDGVARRAMAAYAPVGGLNVPASLTVGLPLLEQSNLVYNGGIAPTNSSSTYRPFVLNRPFRTVGEMSYTWRGGLWKNIDFFTPESGDTALLDVFCVDEILTNGLAAGKINLNTHQAPVLKAILAGAYQDESNDINARGDSGNAAPALAPPVSSTDADQIIQQLLNVTMGTTSWRGPLTNTADLVGRYIGRGVTTGGALDQYTYTNPAGTSYTYAGFSAGLSNISISSWSFPFSQFIQKYREASIRALSATGQTRVWNLLIDVVAQTGRYPQNVSDLTKFSVDGEVRLWVHVAIDRCTGEVIDRQVEVVNE